MPGKRWVRTSFLRFFVFTTEKLSCRRWNAIRCSKRSMLFNSLIFLLYLPIVFLLYWFVFKKLKWQNAFVVVASYIFYGWWDWRFLLLIALTTLCSFFSGIGIGTVDDKRWRRVILWSNIVLNLGILCVFKYFNFFVANLQTLLQPLGISLDSVTVNLILPVGISFYTFQALSYSIDVYRGQIRFTRDIVAFFAFISFFPQLVAGPIERATNLLPQFIKPRTFNYAAAADGCRQILWGFFKKVVVADNCAGYANQCFDSPDMYGGINLWIGALMFTFQIYGDFSGYSDIAIGVARLFGINLMRNFHTPYFSRDIAEFWRRWHISLNTWFRDYIYIPLGGSRCGKNKVIRNTFVIFLVSGLWHGAEWTFVAWGAYHAILFMPLIIIGKNRKFLDEPASGRILPTMSESFMMGITFLLVAIGWVIFRADNLTIAAHYIAKMFTDLALSGPLPPKLTYIWILMLIGVEWVERRRSHPFDIAGHGLLRYQSVRWALYMGVACLCLYFRGVQGEFIYFQF